MSENPYGAPTASLDHDRGLIDIAIGESNSDYYIRYLEGAGDREWAPSWHWPAFFVTFGWLLYRKLWVEWFLYIFALPIAVALAGAVVTTALNENIGTIFQLVVVIACSFVLMPMFASALYARKLRRLVATADARSDDKSERMQWIQKHGGTSMVWMILAPLLLFVIGILATIASLAYQDYTRTANTLRVVAHYEEGARFVANEMRRSKAAATSDDLFIVELPADTDAWIKAINPTGVPSPTGLPAFAPNASDTEGVVGVQASGGQTRAASVTITRPAYLDLTRETITVRLVEL